MKFNFEYFLFISIVSSLFILLIKIITPLTSKKYKRTWRYLVWILLGIRLLIPMDISLRKAYINIDIGEKNSTIAINNKYVAEEYNIHNENLKPLGNKIDVKEEPKAIVLGNNKINNENKEISYDLILNILFYIWILVAVILIIYNFVCYKKIKRRMKIMSKELKSVFIKSQFNKIKRNLKVDKYVEVRVCKLIQSPMVIGWCNPVLYLTSEEYTEDELYYIFLHELVHVKKNHIFVKFLFNIITNIHWFNLFVYMMKKEISKDIELLCDEEVTDIIGRKERKNYGEVILKCIDLRVKREVLFSSSFSGSKKQIKERLVQVMNFNRKRKGVLFTSLALVCILSCSLLVSCRGTDENHGETVNKDSLQSKSSEENENKSNAQVENKNGNDENKDNENKNNENKKVENIDTSKYEGYFYTKKEKLIYRGYAEYGHNIDFERKEKTEKNLKYYYKGQMSDGMGEDKGTRDFKVIYEVTPSKIIEKVENHDYFKNYKDKLNSIISNFIVVSGDIKLGNTWEQSFRHDNKEYSGKTEIIEVGKDTFKTKTVVNNIQHYIGNTYVEERVYKKGYGLIQFNNSPYFKDLKDVPANNDDNHIGIAYSLNMN